MTKETESPFEVYVKKGRSSKIIPMLDSRNREMRIEAARALGRIADDHAMNALIVHLANSDQATRVEIIKALGVTGKQTAKTHLQHLLLVETDDATRQVIRESIALIPRVS